MNLNQSTNKPSVARVAVAAAEILNVSPAAMAAVLANANVKLVFTLQG